MTASAPLPQPDTGALLDSLLVTMVLAGDRRAASRLHARWQPRLVRTARRHTGDGDLAQAAVQECWVSIWRGLPALRETDRFAPWAFGILRRRCADQVNNRVAERARTGEDEPFEQGHDPAPDDRIAITQAFAALSPVHRLAAHLFFVEGLTLAEIAEVQDVPEGTIKSRLFHARRQMKTALTGDNP